jgi:hypothetical protein
VIGQQPRRNNQQRDEVLSFHRAEKGYSKPTQAASPNFWTDGNPGRPGSDRAALPFALTISSCPTSASTLQSSRICLSPDRLDMLQRKTRL